MKEKKPFWVGNARLSDLNGFEDTVKNGVRGCFIPYDQNPSLYVGRNQQTGATTVDLDILVRETQNSKSGSSHFIKLNVGRANRERFQLSPDAVDALRIIGNLFQRVPGQAAQQQGRQAPVPQPQGAAPRYPQSPQPGGYQPQGGYPQQQAPFPRQQFTGDMPDFSAQGAQQAGW